MLWVPGVTDPRETWRDRAELVRIAARRASESHTGISAHFHIGARAIWMALVLGSRACQRACEDPALLESGMRECWFDALKSSPLRTRATTTAGC